MTAHGDIRPQRTRDSAKKYRWFNAQHAVESAPTYTRRSFARRPGYAFYTRKRTQTPSSHITRARSKICYSAAYPYANMVAYANIADREPVMAVKSRQKIARQLNSAYAVRSSRIVASGR
ncbi:hypothetical protein AVEN_190091-1 [Araneus ventricosus]|uniref:Uncharacterized protein n=1 Tax=Araneus ventricosus TaxID=182803 RepID=A0A4Y2STA9_ARAVE|nr:hypothetical protein AVEN_190091-1 [Araneus ventricosus]